VELVIAAWLAAVDDKSRPGVCSVTRSYAHGTNDCSRCTYLLCTRRNYKLVQDKDLPEPQNQDQELRCHTCSAFPRLAQRMLDPRTGKTFRLYRCECGESVWEE